MKNKTMKKAIALILATLMLALATPFAMINVAAEEATPTQIEILLLSAFGNHIKADGTGTQSLNFYGSYPAAAAFDGDITSDAQILNNDGVGNLQYEMCYFDENGNMVNGTNASGKSYYLVFIIELNEAANIDTMSLWTPYVGTSDEAFMANNGYDVYYSEDGQSYTAVEGATFENVYTNKDTNGYYVPGTYNSKNGYVHEIDMKDVTAEFIAIAVSELVYNWDEAIISEVVLMGSEIENDEETEPTETEPTETEPTETFAPPKPADTDAPADDTTEDTTEDSGCASSISVAGVALVGAVAACVAVKSKKKEDN